MAKKIRKKRQRSLPRHLKRVNLHAAGIDIGSRQHSIAVPIGSCAPGEEVKFFDTFTPDLEAMADWLADCGVETVAMESTGVYWIPAYEILEVRGFEVILVDTGQIKYAPGRKTDYLDCQWIQELHTFGLLRGAFRPDDLICQLRGYVRQRGTLITEGSKPVQHIQKALEQMNVKLKTVLREVTGKTGMSIIDAILAGERNPSKLASLRRKQCKHDEADFAKAMLGNWREEHLFALKQSVDIWRYYKTRIAECDAKIENLLGEQPDMSGEKGLASGRLNRPKRRNELNFDGRTMLFQLTGVDLTAIEGIEESTALTIISEIGTDMSHWDNAKRFASWLKVCPGNNKTGGHNKSGKNRRSANRAAQAFRLAAQTVTRSKTSLGAFYRRKAAHRGSGVAMKATAHKLAVLVYSMLKYGTEYVTRSQEHYEKHYRKRQVSHLKRQARRLGFLLSENTETA
jgi:transposase